MTMDAVEHLRNGRVLLQMTDEQIALAEQIAERRESVPRVGEKGARVAQGRQTHREGAYAEVAACDYFGGERHEVRGRTDGGIDFLDPSGEPWQVKSTPVRNAPHLVLREGEHNEAEWYLLCVVDLVAAEVEVCGFLSRAEVLRYPIEDKRHKASGRTYRLRWIPESHLTRCSTWHKPRLAEPHDPPGKRVGVSPGSDDDELDYQRCRKLMRYVDVPNGVLVTAYDPPRRGTLINALTSRPRMPGVRVVLENEQEIVDAKTAQRPRSRSFYSSEVKPANEGGS